MKSLKNLKKHIVAKSISKEASNQLKGGDDKRAGVSGTATLTPPSSGAIVFQIIFP